MSGGAFAQATVFALGIQPYINSSIIIQLLTIAIPALERIAKEGGEAGKRKIERITRYSTVGIALLQALGYYFIMKQNGILTDTGIWAALVIIVSFMAGSSFLMWLGEQCNEFGIGNGISLILFANIVSTGPTLAANMFSLLTGSFSVGNVLGVLAAIVMMLVIITLVVFFSNSERRLPVQYAKRQVGRKMYGGANTHLPIKIMMGGVMPVIFASAIVSLPSTLALIIGGGFQTWVQNWFSSGSVVYVLVMFVLIIAFAYFYIAISFNTVEVANNLKNNGGTILGYRPGQPTAQYIQKVVNRITLIGALFLSFMSIFPILMSWTNNAALSMLVYGGTSVIIAVDVALQTTRDIESETTMRHYKGFLE
jgi:preprotein translocase subunit SecY